LVHLLDGLPIVNKIIRELTGISCTWIGCRSFNGNGFNSSCTSRNCDIFGCCGVSLLADSHGLISGTASNEDVLSFVLDVALVGVGLGLSHGITVTSTRLLSSISKGSTVVTGIDEAVHEYRILNAIQTMSQTCMDTARDMIVSLELKNKIEYITGWDVA